MTALANGAKPSMDRPSVVDGGRHYPVRSARPSRGRADAWSADSIAGGSSTRPATTLSFRGQVLLHLLECGQRLAPAVDEVAEHDGARALVDQGAPPGLGRPRVAVDNGAGALVDVIEACPPGGCPPWSHP
jgi:hypothetical protein